VRFVCLSRVCPGCPRCLFTGILLVLDHRGVLLYNGFASALVSATAPL
jgi:hypothetical protein